MVKGRLADGALKNAYAEGTLPTTITVGAPSCSGNTATSTGLGGGQEHADHLRQRRQLEGVQLVGGDGARSIQLNLTDMRQRPTVIPLVAVAFCGVSRCGV